MNVLVFVYAALTVCAGVLLDDGTFVDLIKLVSEDHYFYPLIKRLDEGIINNTLGFLSVNLDTSLLQDQFCDFQVAFHTKNGEVKRTYVPSICEHWSSCNGTFEVGEWVNKTCQLYAERLSLDGFVCCPATLTKKYGPTYPRNVTPDTITRSYFEFDEVPPNFKLVLNSSFNTISANTAQYVADSSVLEKVLNPSYGERLKKELVCGFEKGDKIKEAGTSTGGRDIYNIEPFFCTRPRDCQRTHTAEVGWMSFCELTAIDGKSVCCHADDIAESSLGVKYIHLPQLPLFLKYVPGLRSAFKCEEYSKVLCKGDLDICVRSPERRPPLWGQVPYLAVLGFIVPRFMMFHCGGTLISRRYILSTATCQHFFGYKTNVVLLGEHYTEEVIEVSGFKKTYLLTDILTYKRSGFHLQPNERLPEPQDVVDLALYRTDVDVEFSHFIRPACLFHQIQAWPEVLNFAGIGNNKTDSPRSKRMKIIPLPRMNKDLCKRPTNFPDANENPFYGKFGVKQSWMICYGSRNSTYLPCQFDTGGPLLMPLNKLHCSSQLVGVLSSKRFFCDKFLPAVFINVTLFIKAIEDEIWGDYTFLEGFEANLQKRACSTVEKEDLMFFSLTRLNNPTDR